MKHAYILLLLLFLHISNSKKIRLMQKKTILLLVILILLINTISYSQSKIDSLNFLLQTAEGNQKGEILYKLGNEYRLCLQ